MESKELTNIETVDSKLVAMTSTQVVTADSVQAEEVPTIPLGSLQTISTLQPEVSVRSVASTHVVSIPAPLVVQPSEYRRSFTEWAQMWLDGVRPAYLPLSLMPVLVGSMLAWTQTVTSRTPLGYFHLTHFIITIVAVVLLQLGAHLVNDYYDYLRGIDTSNTFGPGGLIQQGLIPPTRVLTFGLILLGVSAVLGIVVAASSSPLIFLFGLIGLMCAYFYSASLRSLSSLGLSEVVCFAIFGPLITVGAYLSQGGQALNTALIYSLPLGFLAAAVIHANNMRDNEGDAHANKLTVASTVGLQWSRILYVILLLAAYIVILFLGIPPKAPHLILITLWTLPTLVVAITGALRTDSPAGLQLVMHQSLKLEVFFTLLLTAALIASAFVPVLSRIPLHILPI